MPTTRAYRQFSVAFVALVALVVAGCKTLTDVKTTGTIDETTISGPLGALNRYNGAIRVIAGAMVPVISASGGFTDELQSAGAFVSSVWAIETRSVPEQSTLVTSGDHFNAYNRLHQARIDILHTIDALKRDAPTPAARIGRMYGLAAYAETLLGELFCSGVPLSDYEDTQIAYGDPLTTTQLLQHAVQMFDSALLYSADTLRFLNLARVGKGRALLNLGRYSEAATAVAAVPTTYRYDLEFNATIQPDSLFQVSGSIGPSSYTVADRQGGTGLDFRGANDPRVRTTAGALGADGVTRYFLLSTLSSFAAPITLATGTEARLIEAEAALAGGNAATWLAKLNDPRAAAITPAMTPLADPGTLTARVDLTFRERAFWMYVTAHRLGDARRLIRQYNRTPASVFPSQGTFKDGTAWGNDVNLPIPDTERYNPKFTGCLDRSA